MKTLEYIAAVKAARHIESDYAAAKLLGLTRSALSSMRCGKSTMSDETALRIADILGLPPLVVIADAHMEQIDRAKRPALEDRALWERVAKKAAGAAALLLLASGLSAPVDGWAAGVRAGAVQFIHYAQSIYRRLAAVGRFYALRPA